MRKRGFKKYYSTPISSLELSCRMLDIACEVKGHLKVLQTGQWSPCTLTSWPITSADNVTPVTHQSQSTGQNKSMRLPVEKHWASPLHNDVMCYTQEVASCITYCTHPNNACLHMVIEKPQPSPTQWLNTAHPRSSITYHLHICIINTCLHSAELI